MSIFSVVLSEFCKIMITFAANYHLGYYETKDIRSEQLAERVLPRGGAAAEGGGLVCRAWQENGGIYP